MTVISGAREKASVTLELISHEQQFNSQALIHLRLCKSCYNLFISRATTASVAAALSSANIYGNDSRRKCEKLLLLLGCCSW